MSKFNDASVALIKSWFNAGDQPTEAQFAAWVTAIQEGFEEHLHQNAAGGGDGTASGIINFRPELNIAEIKKQTVPTDVQVGIFFGYSLPIYAADHEELYYTQLVPGRWDGASDIKVHVLVALGGAEDVDDNFKFQLSWEHCVTGEPIPGTSHNVEVQQTVLAGRSAQYDTYLLEFVLDYDVDGAGNEVTYHELLGVRLRRIDADNPDVANEIIVLDMHDEFDVNKMFAA